MPSPVVVPADALLVVTLVLVHGFVGHLRFLDVTPRSLWLSVASGVSVAYVFMHLLPELGHATHEIAGLVGNRPGPARHGHLLALLGLVTFYGLERLIRTTPQGAGISTARAILHLHVASFAAYNVLFGYLLAQRATEPPERQLAYGIAMGLHFLVVDYGLYRDHRRHYQQRTRWLLALALPGGWWLGQIVVVGPATTGAFFAFLAGGIVLNVLKEELPAEHESRFLPFALGAAGYAALLGLV